MGASWRRPIRCRRIGAVGSVVKPSQPAVAHFHWGVVAVEFGRDSAAPAPSGVAGQPRQSGARALVQRVLCHTGVIFSLAASQGGSAHVILQRERVFSVSASVSLLPSIKSEFMPLRALVAVMVATVVMLMPA